MVEFDQTGPPPEGVDLVAGVAVEPAADPARPRRSVCPPAPVVVDSTASTPSTFALEQGADFVLHSATKFLGGHHDVLLGAVVCKTEDDYEQLLQFRSRSGIVAAPDAAWLLRRSLETLELRMRRHENATEITRRLQAHRAVERVRYPGFGELLSFDVAGGAEAAQRVEQSVEAIKNATSLGGTRSVLETRARWEGDRVPENLVRLERRARGRRRDLGRSRAGARPGKGRRRARHDRRRREAERKQQRCRTAPPSLCFSPRHAA